MDHSIWRDKKGNWNTWLPDPSKGRKRVKKKTRKEIEDVILTYLAYEADNPTIENMFKEWLERRLRLKKISGATFDRYKRVYERHYRVFGKRKIKGVMTEDVSDFLEEEIARCDLTAKGYANLKTITRGLFGYAKKKKKISWEVSEVFDNMDISKNTFKVVIKEDYEEVFNEEEMRLIIQYLIENLDIHNIGILLIFITGIRCGELVTLKHSDFEDFSFKIRRTETRYEGPDGKDIYGVKSYPKSQAGVRTCVVPEDYWWLLKRLHELSPDEEYIFSKNGHRMTTNTMRNRLWRICKKIGIFNKSPHKVRKTYVTILLDNKVDNNLILSVVGHAKIDCSESNYHRNRKKITQKAQIISNIKDFKLDIE